MHVHLTQEKTHKDQRSTYINACQRPQGDATCSGMVD